MRLKKSFRKVIWIIAVAFFSCVVYLLAVYKITGGKQNLAIKWEGLVNDYNFRDVGASLNECLGVQIFREGVLFRSSMWFSGWPCNLIGNPDVIYSLNFDPSNNNEYFCRGPKNLVGLHYNRLKKLHDIEFLAAWETPSVRSEICPYFEESLKDIGAGKRVLIHCNAGRDRTGTYAALIAGLTLEYRQRLNDLTLNAIECDYRKTRSLVPEKFGRMRNFLENIRKKGTISHFMNQACGIDQGIIEKALQQLAKG